jgi:putative tricarboxylic transport membrane protein
MRFFSGQWFVKNMFKIKYLHNLSAGLLLALLPAAHAAAQAWVPTKNVEIVHGSAPGGSNDKRAREIEKALAETKLVPTTMTVVSKAGGGGGISMAYANQHPGDGHYLLVGGSTMISNHILGASKLNYTDFTPIASLMNDYIVFAVSVDSPLKTAKDLLERLKANPQSLSIGFASAFGNSRHVGGGLLMRAAGRSPRDMKVVVFKGSAEAISALLGGHIDVAILGAINSVAHVATGRMRVLAAAAPRRFGGALAQVPTWNELGVDVVSGSWGGVFGPRNLSAAQLAFWEEGMRQVSRNPGWKADLEKNYWLEDFAVGAQFRQELEKDYATNKRVLVDVGLAK